MILSQTLEKLAVATSSEDSIGAGSTSETASSPGGGQIPQFLVGCWPEASVLHVELSIDLFECLHDVAAGFQEKKHIHKKTKKRPRKSHSTTSLYSPC